MLQGLPQGEQRRVLGSMMVVSPLYHHLDSHRRFGVGIILSRKELEVLMRLALGQQVRRAHHRWHLRHQQLRLRQYLEFLVRRGLGNLTPTNQTANSRRLSYAWEMDSWQTYGPNLRHQVYPTQTLVQGLSRVGLPALTR